MLTEEWDGVRWGGHSGGDKAAAASRGSSRRSEGRGATAVREGRLGGRRWTVRSWGRVGEGARAGLGRGTEGAQGVRGVSPSGMGVRAGRTEAVSKQGRRQGPV